MYLLIHSQPLVWVSFDASTTSGMSLFLFIHNLKRDLFDRLWMNKKRPIPEVVDEYKETHTRGCG
jgi:hypothetical protein